MCASLAFDFCSCKWELGIGNGFDFRVVVLVPGCLAEKLFTASDIKTNGFILIVDFLDFFECLISRIEVFTMKKYYCLFK
jgi:hypothetical protein